MARIAVVNDDTVFLELMAQLLEMEGYESTIIREGSSAYERIKNDPPDLVVLDIRLGKPEQGWMVCELLLLDPVTRSIPIIICSAAIDDLRARAEWLEEKGIGFIPKPFDLNDLVAAVETALEPGQHAIEIIPGE